MSINVVVQRRAIAIVVLGMMPACGDHSRDSVSDGNTGANTSGTTDDGGGDPSTTGDSASAETGAGSTGGGVKYDVGDGGGITCNCEVEYIWIANSEEGTVSKIDVETLTEVGRYRTRSDGMGNPSRTSVSLSGDVAVANRHGGLAKFYGDLAKCEDTNGTPGIQTSTGKNDVLPWDQEECRAWYVDFPNTSNQRPVAWAQGYVTPGTCSATDEKVWTVTSAVKGLFPGLGGNGGVIVYLLDGATGAIEKQIPIETFPGGSFGAYGGAVDSAGNFYFTSMGPGGKIARVDRLSFAYQIWTTPAAPYGITVDHKNRVWLSSNAIGQVGGMRFDPMTETWDQVMGFWSGAGLGEGPGNRMWISSNQGVSSVDIDTLAPGPVFMTSELVKGVGFDSNGFLFAATYAVEDDMGNLQGNDLLFKVDPDTLTVVDYYDGLDRPYTYSDMTGHALGNVTCPPEG